MGFFDIFKSPTQVARDYVKSDKFIEDLRRDMAKYNKPRKYAIMRTTDMKWLCIENNEVKWNNSSYIDTMFVSILVREGAKAFRTSYDNSILLKYTADTDTISITNNPEEAIYTVIKKDGDTRMFYFSETYMVIEIPRN